MPTDDFDWNDDDYIVQRATPTLAVYSNPAGDVVIRKRQNNDDYDSSDVWIVIARGSAAAVAQAILDYSAIGPVAVQAGAQKKTSAERTRKWRERRHGDAGDADVTPCDADPVDLLSRLRAEEVGGGK